MSLEYTFRCSKKDLEKLNELSIIQVQPKNKVLQEALEFFYEKTTNLLIDKTLYNWYIWTAKVSLYSESEEKARFHWKYKQEDKEKLYKLAEGIEMTRNFILRMALQTYYKNIFETSHFKTFL